MSEWEYASTAVVSAIVNDPKVLARVAQTVKPQMLTGSAQRVYEVMLGMAEAEEPIDQTTLHHAWMRSGWSSSWGNTVIIDLYRMGVTTGSLDYHLEALMRLVGKEQLLAIGERLTLMAQAADAVPGDVAEAIREQLDRAMTMLERPHEVTLVGTSDIEDYVMPPARWLIPNMLKRQQRVMWVAGEGMGKSTLLAQMALAGAAGVHPFTGAAIPTFRTLVIDAENSPDDAMENWQAIVQTMKARRYPSPGDRFKADPVGRPLDLCSAYDQSWLRTRIEAHRPDLLCIGPLYMLSAMSLIDEDGMTQLLRFLARIRSDYDLTIVLESHAGNESAGHVRQMRPYGSSLQRRNMEFGFGLVEDRDKSEQSGRRVVQVTRWRGGRSRRSLWPLYVTPGRGDAVWWDDVTEEIETWGSR